MIIVLEFYSGLQEHLKTWPAVRDKQEIIRLFYN